MNGQHKHKCCADGIKREHRCLEDRGVHPHSYFEVQFVDGSVRTEHETNWRDLSVEKTVEYFGGKKTVKVCQLPVKRVVMRHGDLSTIIDVPEGVEVYQAIRSETIFVPGGRKIDRISGRVVGLVKDNKVIEERFLNAAAGEVFGARA